MYRIFAIVSRIRNMSRPPNLERVTCKALFFMLIISGRGFYGLWD